MTALVVVSRAPEADCGCADDCSAGPDDALVAALCAAGLPVLVVPHLYYLHSGDEAVRRMSARGGDLLVASHLHPRAALATLRALGVEADVQAWNVDAFESDDVGARTICAATQAGQNPPTKPIVLCDSPAARWYPVLDPDRCTHCGQCVDFCLFGVYERCDGRVTVVHPDNCKPGCPACARVCPDGAIIFPHYTDDPGIAGVPGAEIAIGGVDVDRVFAAVQRARAGEAACPVCGCACDCERMADDAEPPPGWQACPACGCLCDTPTACACAPGECAPGDVQDLVNALDEFDD